MDLFEYTAIKNEDKAEFHPLAFRMRPQTLDEYAGQQHILGEGKLLRRLLKTDRIGSLIFYGPPGTGKTTLALLISKTTGSRFVSVNAVTSNVQELRAIIDSAKKTFLLNRQRTILFVDEIHRFNKSQQDVLLPHIEENTVGFIATTTQNPCLALTSPLVSRSHVFQFEMLTHEDIVSLLKRAIGDDRRGLGSIPVRVGEDVLDEIARNSDGDARKALNMLEVIVLTAPHDVSENHNITLEEVKETIQHKFVRYDEDDHYDTISAFIKSMRGSDPDAALYWLAKMLEAGEDPRFIARRIVICAAEDVGTADPQALTVAVSAFNALEFVGMPESKFFLAEATVYIATAPKSNAVTVAINEAQAAVRNKRLERVPDHLRDAHYKGASKLGAGDGYQYPHDFPGHFVAQKYREGVQKFYSPTRHGYEQIIQDRIAEWNRIRNNS
ncbi:MAG: replication-associated recombination protein A [Candidatus Auribacterota bacterium]|jgi:putative ATPase|nr:replication-associated recombination protein A [Candidatus Auribacterota bacterium]